LYDTVQLAVSALLFGYGIQCKRTVITGTDKKHLLIFGYFKQ